MDCNRDLILLSIGKDGLVIATVQVNTCVVGMDLDAIQSIFHDSLTNRFHGFSRSIPGINVCEGIKLPRKALLHLIEILMYRFDSKLHRHEPRVIKGHSDRFLNS